MSNVKINIDTKEINRVVIGLKGFDKQMAGATVSAINRTLEFVKNRVGRIVSQEYAVKSTDVKKTLKTRKASKSFLNASIVSTGRRLSMAHFPLNPKVPGKKRAVKIKIKKSKGYVVVNHNPKPFIMATGALSEDKIQNNVFVRVGKKRFPVHVLRTVSIPQMIGNDKVTEEIMDIAQKKLDERVTHEMNWRLDKLSKKR